MKTRNQDLYEISAVARLTGISPHVLRVWERRYGVVEPQRSDSKRRRYSADDIQRLCLIKSLVDHGHAISTVAGLQLAQLEEREAAAVQAKESEEVPEFFPTHGIRIAVIGTKVRQALRSAEEQSSSMRVVGEFLDATELIASLKPEAADLVVVERDTLFPEDVAEIQELIATLQVKRAIVVAAAGGHNLLMLRGRKRSPHSRQSGLQGCGHQSMQWKFVSPVFLEFREGSRVKR